jgi:hypothetical protein
VIQFNQTKKLRKPIDWDDDDPDYDPALLGKFI